MRTSLMKLGLFALLASFSITHADEDNETLKKEKLEYVVQTVPQKYVIGIQMRTNSWEVPFSLPKFWKKFYNEDIFNKIPNKISTSTLAIYSDYEGDSNKPFKYTIGVEVSSLENVPQGMIGMTIPESKCAIITSRGAYPNSIVKLWKAVWNSDLPRAYGADYEVYRQEFDANTNSEVKVYISLE